MRSALSFEVLIRPIPLILSFYLGLSLLFCSISFKLSTLMQDMQRVNSFSVCFSEDFRAGFKFHVNVYPRNFLLTHFMDLFEIVCVNTYWYRTYTKVNGSKSSSVGLRGTR